MKNLHYFLLAALIFITLSSCNSDDNTNPKIDAVINDGSYSFMFSIKVSDDEGENLLSVPDEDEIPYGFTLTKGEIRFRVIDMSINNPVYIGCAVMRNVDDEVLLNMYFYGKHMEGDDPVKIVEFTWGRQAELDSFKYELSTDGDEVKCIKVWHNDELKCEIGSSDVPVFSIVKDHNYYKLIPLVPIVLKYPEKAKTDNQFAFNLFKKTIANDLGVDKQNTFVSPLSVSLSLNMLINGAEGETKEEIKTALEANDYSVEQINEHSKELIKSLTSVDPTTSISIANSIWPAIGYPIVENFIQTNINYYDAVVHPIDFLSYDAIKTVNNWCAEKTKGMIPEPINRFPDNIRLLLINALYFKSDWSPGYSFSNFTGKEYFYLTDGSKTVVDMMHRTNTYLYKSESGAGYLKIPFGNRAFSMVIILPDEDVSIHTIVDNIDNDPSWTTSGGMTYRLVNLSLPKFKMDFSYKMEDYIFPEMGMKSAFFPNIADLRGISESDNPLYVSEIIHKTAIEVNETGAAASAITIQHAEGASDGSEPPVIIDFRVNRPFIFSICEESTGTILFIGKIEKLGN